MTGQRGERLPEEVYPSTAPLFTALETRYDGLLAASRGMMFGRASTLYVADFFYWGVAKRAVDVVDAIITLTRQWNATAAIAMTRVHLDTLVRVAYVVEEPGGDAAAEAVLKGTPFRQLRDPAGKQLTDAYLVKRLAQRLPWVQEVYDTTNSLVHLSERHIFTSLGEVGEDRKVTALIGRGFDRWTEADITELLVGSMHITDEIISCLEAWAACKIARSTSAPATSSGTTDCQAENGVAVYEERVCAGYFRSAKVWHLGQAARPHRRRGFSSLGLCGTVSGHGGVELLSPTPPVTGLSVGRLCRTCERMAFERETRDATGAPVSVHFVAGVVPPPSEPRT